MTICSLGASLGGIKEGGRAYHRMMHLLLVEDELEIQGFLKKSLADAGYVVEVAGDGKTAEGLASAKTYDALIVDLGLPDQDGIDLILRLRQIGVNSPVMILSARRSVDDRVRGLRASATEADPVSVTVVLRTPCCSTSAYSVEALARDSRTQPCDTGVPRWLSDSVP